MPVQGLDHVAITVNDTERTAQFDRDVPGAEALFLDTFRHENFSVVSLVIDSNRINLPPTPPRTPPQLLARPPVPGAADLCLRWDGPIGEVVALLSEHDLPLVEGPVPRPASDGADATSVSTRDPDGNLIEFLTGG
jgi:catechol 2,3-dioxygenase-like lactoylglutathione lyase family enzyme